MNNRELAKQLDYTIYSDVARAAFVAKLLGTNDWEASLCAQMERGGLTENSPVVQQLETLANYIMYGKNQESGKNAIERKEITQPSTHYSTYTRKEHLSLDELGESPAFDEQETRPIERNSYLTPKRKITRPVYGKEVSTGEIVCLNEKEHDGAIPGMAQLWEAIDHLEWLAGKQERHPAPFSDKTYLVDGRRVHKVNHTVKSAPDGTLYVDSTPPVAPPKLSPLMAYRLKHWLVDQKKHQYYLKESNSPTAFAQHFSFTPPSPVDWEQDSGYWLTQYEAFRLKKKIDLTRWRWRQVTRDLYEQYSLRATSDDSIYDFDELGYYFGSKNLVPEEYLTHISVGYSPTLSTSTNYVKEYFCAIAPHTIDFTDPLHVYALLENFRDLKITTYDKLNSQMRHILDAFSEIVDKTDLHESRDIILYYKVHKWTNERIAQELAEFGYSYATNYISTIYKKEICTKIARQAQMMDEEWHARNDRLAWRRCTDCGKNKLANTNNFTSKPKNYGGLSYRCKACDKLARERRKSRDGQSTMSVM